MRFTASVPDSEVVFDYTEPLANYPERRRAYLAGVAARTAALGESWKSYFDPGDISAELSEYGFQELPIVIWAPPGSRPRKVRDRM